MIYVNTKIAQTLMILNLMFQKDERSRVLSALLLDHAVELIGMPMYWK